MKVAQWGDGLAVQLPEDVVKRLGLKVGDEVQVEVTFPTSSDDETETGKRRQQALANMRAMARPLPERWKFDRDEANRRGPE